MRTALLPRATEILLAAALALAPRAEPAQNATVLSVSPLRLVFIGAEGADTLPAQPVEVNSVGSGRPRWRVRVSAPWIVVSPDHGEGAARMLVRIASRALPAGTHRGTIIIEAADAPRSPAVVTVSASLAHSPRQRPSDVAVPLRTTPARVDFSAPAGQQDPLSFNVRVEAERGATVRWFASVDRPWLSIRPVEGTTPANIALTTTLGQLTPGTYDGSLTVGANRQEPVVRVPVRLLVETALGPLAFVSQALPSAGMNVAYSHAIAVRGGRPPYRVSLVHGQLPPELSVVNGVLSGIPRATGTFVFSIAAQDSADPPATALGTFVLTVSVIDQNTALLVRPAEILLTATAGQRAAAVTMSVASGGPPLTWNITSGAPWLKVQPSSGVAPASATLTADTRDLAPGSYSSVLVVSMDGAPNSPVTVAVRVIVK